MPSVLQFRRGTTSQNNSFTGAAGEISVDTDTNTLRVHDGSTAGGSALVSEAGTQTLTNKTLTSPTITGVSPTITLGGDLSGSLTLTNLGGGTLTATLTKDPTITLTGDVTGSATMTNLGNVSIVTTIAANSVALGTDTTGNYVAAGATSGNGISGSVSSEGGTFTVTSNATSANTGSTIVFRDASGNFSAGTITATATNAQYADLAENYLADQSYPIGTVLQIGGVAEVTVAIEKNYGVVGTVSDKPGYLMNSELIGEHVTPVAYIGRVPCRVKGTVRRGELLVVSNTPGVAISKDPREILPGQLVGKALQEHNNDNEGLIEILVGRL